MESLRRYIFVFFLIAFFSGCSSNDYPYRYISLENVPEIEILAKGRSNLVGLKNHDEMPVKYGMVRNDYALIFEVDRNSYWPTIIIFTEQQDGLVTSIRGYSLSKCGAFRSQGLDSTVTTYTWAPPFSRNCTREEALKDERVFQLKVFRGEDLLGDELVHFQLKNNGTYTEYDAL